MHPTLTPLWGGRCRIRAIRGLHLECRQALAQRGQVGDRLALAGDVRLQLVGAGAGGEELLGELAAGEACVALDPRLAAQGRPVEDRGGAGVGAQLLGLAGPEAGGEDERAVLESLERDDPSRGSAVGIGGGERHRRGGRDLGLAGLLEPAGQELEWIVWRRLAHD